MNIFSRRAAFWLLCLAWLAMASPGWAQECLSLSPSIQAGKDPFAAIQTRELTPAEREGLMRLFQSLAGDWQGRSGTFFCRSTVDPADRSTENLAAKAKVAVDYYGNLFLDCDLLSEADRTGSKMNVRLFINDRRLRIDHDTGAGDVQIEQISDHGLSFFYRRVSAAGRSGASQRREYFFILEVSGNTLRVEQTLYVQGKLSSGYDLRLAR